MDPVPTSPGLAGHPRGLATLFLTEMWERFTFYGMRSLLVLFMTAAVVDGGLGLDDRTATSIYGLYIGCVYLFSWPGGWIADRLIGQRNAVIAGALLMAGGSFLLAAQNVSVFYLGLIVIVLGVGLLKSNVSVMVGQLYAGQSSARRDAGFLLFYIGINLGAVLAPLVIGTIGEKVSWRAGFAVSGLFMLAGLAQFVLQRRHLPQVPVTSTPAERRRSLRVLLAGGGALALLLALMFGGVVPVEPVVLARYTGLLMVLMAAGFFGYVFAFGKLTRDEAQRVAVILILFVSVAVFILGYELAGSTFNLFARDYTDRSWLGSWFADGQHPTSWYQSLGPFYIVVFAPVFGAMWVRLAQKNLEPSLPAKFGLGLIQVGIGFVVMAWAAWLVVQGGGGTRVAPVWLLLTYMLHTFGELCVSPIGLSAITALSPKRYTGQMMGTWFAGVALGNLLSGVVAGTFGEDTLASAPTRFLMICAIDVAAGCVLLVLARKITQLMGSAR
ncbi:MAG: peptide MFS transporter [Solimonas sp.]